MRFDYKIGVNSMMFNINVWFILWLVIGMLYLFWYNSCVCWRYKIVFVVVCWVFLVFFVKSLKNKLVISVYLVEFVIFSCKILFFLIFLMYKKLMKMNW